MTKQLAHQILTNYINSYGLPNKDCDVWVGTVKYTFKELIKIVFDIK